MTESELTESQATLDLIDSHEIRRERAESIGSRDTQVPELEKPLRPVQPSITPRRETETGL